MRNIDGTLNGDLNDNISAIRTGSITIVPTSSIDENLTTYDLLPVIINEPPIITKPIAEASRPKIRSSATADATGKFLYEFPDGTIKVAKGTTFELRIEAAQPNTFNIENGVPVIKEASQDLYYQWRQDEAIIRTYKLDTLGHQTIISGSVIRFERIQPNDAGTYTVEISNDIGSVISEPVTIEVYNLDLDSYFYRNLVVNGSATDGTNGWEGDTSEFVARSFSKKSTVELRTPYRVDLFGYNVDTMHPRPYQLETSVVKGINYERQFLATGNGGYFSRDVYKFEKAGGKFYVKTYQDIDVSEIQDFIKGSVYGIDGVRAVFGCYIGNAVSSYVPTKETMLLETKTNPINYFLGAPRISLENFLMAGPGRAVDRVYVTLEEYDNETRLVSRLLNDRGQVQRQANTITLQDPWTKRLSKHYGKQYYPVDVYRLGSGDLPITPGPISSPPPLSPFQPQIGPNGLLQQVPDIPPPSPTFVQLTSPGNWYDATLFTADELYPDPNKRPTHGQYLEFNRLVLERLNPKTTKIRIGIHFYMDDLRLFDIQDYENTGSDRIWETVSWEKNYKKGTFKQEGSTNEVGFIRSTIASIEKYKDRPLVEQVPLAPPPRVAVTGLALALLPIERQNAADTKYYTSAVFNKNNRPEVRLPSALDPDAVFDPKGLLKRTLMVYFEHNSNPKVLVQADGRLITTNKTSMRFKVELSGLPPEQPTPAPTTLFATPNSIFPFGEGAKVSAYGMGFVEYNAKTNAINSSLEDYSNIVYKLPSGSQVTPQLSASLQTAAQKIVGPVTTQVTEFIPPTSKVNTKVGLWKNRFSYTLHYITRPPGNPVIPTIIGNALFEQYTNRFNLVVDYSQEKPVKLFADQSKGFEEVFDVTDYGIDEYGGFYFSIPSRMATFPAAKGGLGIPEVEYSGPFIGEQALLAISSSLPSSSVLASASFDVRLQRNLSNLFTGYVSASGIMPPEAGEISTEYSALLSKRPFFEKDITEYVFAASGSLSLPQLKVKWGVDNITANIQTSKKIPNPEWTVSLYAVSAAPQIGTNFNGTPVAGRGLDGASYTVTYARISDEQTQI